MQKLGEIASVKGGKRLPKGESLTTNPNSHPYIRTKDIENHVIKFDQLEYVPDMVQKKIARYIVDAGNLVVSIVGTVGSCAIVPAELHRANLTENCAKILLNTEDYTTHFLYYFLRSPQGQQEIFKNTVGSTQLKLPLYGIENIDLPRLTVTNQKAIAHILGTLDDKIELNQKMSQTLEDIVRAIFKSWFVDFDPVRAKARGHPTGLPPEISDLFPDNLVDSEIGETPDGWEVLPLSEQIRVNPKYTLKKGTAAYFVEMKCLSESTSSVSEGYVRSFTSGSKFQRFDTLFARITPCLENGKTGLLLNKSASDICWGSTEFIVLSPQDDQSPLFPYCWARNENLRTAAVSSMTGSSGRQRVPNDFFDSYIVANPDALLHQTFRSIADPIMHRIQVCNDEMTTLSELRDTLLPKLISGALRIPDAEKFLEEAGI